MYEEKTILSSLVNKFKITSLESQDNIKITADLVLRPLNGVHLKLQTR